MENTALIERPGNHGRDGNNWPLRTQEAPPPPPAPPPAEPLPLSLTCITTASSSTRCCPASPRRDQPPSASRSAMVFRAFNDNNQRRSKTSQRKIQNPMMTLQKSNQSLGLSEVLTESKAQGGGVGGRGGGGRTGGP